MERENVELRNNAFSAAGNTLETQPLKPKVNDSNHLHLTARAWAVGVQYEFSLHAVVETEDEKRQF